MKIKPTRKNCIDYLYLIAMHFNYEFVRHPDCERFKMYAEVAEESIELLKKQEAVEPKQVGLYGKNEWWGLVCVCPDCKAEWMSDEADTHFCPKCG